MLIVLWSARWARQTRGLAGHPLALALAQEPEMVDQKKVGSLRTYVNRSPLPPPPTVDGKGSEPER